MPLVLVWKQSMELRGTIQADPTTTFVNSDTSSLLQPLLELLCHAAAWCSWEAEGQVLWPCSLNNMGQHYDETKEATYLHKQEQGWQDW